MTLSPSALHTGTHLANVSRTEEYNEPFVAKIYALLTMMNSMDSIAPIVWRPVENRDYNTSSLPCSWRSGNLVSVEYADITITKSGQLCGEGDPGRTECWAG